MEIHRKIMRRISDHFETHETMSRQEWAAILVLLLEEETSKGGEKEDG